MADVTYNANDRYVPTSSNPRFLNIEHIDPDLFPQLNSYVNKYCPITYLPEIAAEFVTRRVLQIDPTNLRRGTKFDMYNFRDKSNEFVERKNKFDGIIYSKPWHFIEVKYGTYGFHISKFELIKASEVWPHYTVVKVNIRKFRNKWEISSVQFINFNDKQYILDKINHN